MVARVRLKFRGYKIRKNHGTVPTSGDLLMIITVHYNIIVSTYISVTICGGVRV